MTDIRVCFIGDSITMGQNDPQCLGWPGRLSALAWQNGHTVSCYNLGVRSDTSADIAGRWAGECGPRLPEKTNGGIILMFGVNDMADRDNSGPRVPLPASVDNARAIFTVAGARYRCLWVGPTPVRDDVVLKSPHLGVTFGFSSTRTANLNEAYRNLAGEMKIPFLDLHERFSASRTWNEVLETGDGVHPTPRGYGYLAEAIDRWQDWRRWFDRGSLV